MLDTAYVSAIAALAGSAIGGFSSFATSWLTERTQERERQWAQSLSRREQLYEAFIDEASNLFADALTHKLDEPAKLVRLYAITSKLRLFATPEIVAMAEASMQAVLDIYYSPNLDFSQEEALRQNRMDVLRAFSEACHAHLRRSYAGNWVTTA